ncbi:MAG: transketolase C-terminal domain-containing protein, partial [Ignavibacteria bacterium]|nr:transketolase C-terminal domain-containing protein [Ignavibacteria bacterium]
EIKPFQEIPLGKWEVLKNGVDVAVLAVGKMVSYAIPASDILKEKNISCHVVNARFIKPLDSEMLDYLFAKFDKFITLEDGQISGGFGSSVLEYFASKQINNKFFKIHGIPDKFIEHGTQDELFHDLLLDTDGIVTKIEQMF